MRHIDKLNQLLRAYNSALGDLRTGERNLLSKQISTLNRKMSKGLENHNWFSLSIGEFIKECQLAIESFKEVKGRVLQHARNIEKQVHTIENAVIIAPIDFKTTEIMDITQFSEYFEKYRVNQITSLVKDYHNIGDIYLKTIEECTFKESSQGHKEMQMYYYYWERKIFNAINKMIIRALATNKALLGMNGKPLIQMQASYNFDNSMSYHPTTEELRTQLDKFNRNILESAKRFGRWWDGFCKVFEEDIDKETSEKTIKYTFFDDINHNPVITKLNLELVTSTEQIQKKFEMYEQTFQDAKFRKVYDKNWMNKILKGHEKAGSVASIERDIMAFRGRSIEIKNKQAYVQNYLVMVDYSEVISNAIDQVSVWFDSLGKILTDIARRELSWVMNETKKYEEKLAKDMAGIEQIKELLNVINEIRNKSMDMELKINEVLEMFRVLKIYEYEIEKEEQDNVDLISENWAALLDLAERSDFKLVQAKKQYADITKNNVEDFKKELHDRYEMYVANGPGAEHVTLEEGCRLLEDSK